MSKTFQSFISDNSLNNLTELIFKNVRHLTVRPSLIFQFLECAMLNVAVQMSEVFFFDINVPFEVLFYVC